MACRNCRARSQMLQDAVLEMKLAKAAGHAVKGAAEILGLKEKTGAAEMESELSTETQDTPEPEPDAER